MSLSLVLMYQVTSMILCNSCVIAYPVSAGLFFLIWFLIHSWTHLHVYIFSTSKISPAFNSADSRPKLVAGSAEGYSGHVDGRLRDARMNHPNGITVDDRGHIYVADTMNMAIRKISDSGRHYAILWIIFYPPLPQGTLFFPLCNMHRIPKWYSI